MTPGMYPLCQYFAFSSTKGNLLFCGHSLMKGCTVFTPQKIQKQEKQQGLADI
jgi:hypothetical protein